MTNITLRLDTSCDSEYTDQYGDWWAWNYIEVVGAEICKKGYSETQMFIGHDDVCTGDTIYIVEVEYSSGDSFGSESGIKTWPWAFKDMKIAEKLASAIREDYKDSKSKVMFEGVEIHTYEWKDYFGGMDEVSVVEVVLE